MPRNRREPLAQCDINVAPESTIADPKSTNTTNKIQAAGATVKKTKVDNTNEVDQLRAQVADLTAKLEAAQISAKPAAKDNKESEAVNPFGGEIPSLSMPLPMSLPMPSAVQIGPKPKRPQTAYHCFSAAHRDQVREKEPKLSALQVTAKLAQMWQSADASVRAEYEAKVAADRKRYEREMADYDAKRAGVEEERQALEMWQQKQKQQKALAFYEAHIVEQKNRKDPNDDAVKKPKKPRSAYIFYTIRRHDEMAAASTAKPEDAATIISEEWKTLQASRKKKDRAIVQECMQKANQDQERYQKEQKAYELEMAAREAESIKQREELLALAIDMYRANKKERDEIAALRKLQHEQKEHEKVAKAAARAAKKEEKAKKADQPKRARTAYMFFFADKSKDTAVRQQAELEQVSVATMIASLWRDCSDGDKADYVKFAEEDRVRYDREMAAQKN